MPKAGFTPLRIGCGILHSIRNSRRFWSALYGAGSHMPAAGLVRFAFFGPLQTKIQAEIGLEIVNQHAPDPPTPL